LSTNNGYNLLTVCNSSYSVFLDIWLRSLHKNINMELVKNVYIVDTGMSEEQMSFAKQFDSVKIIQTNIDGNSSSVHDQGWKNSTFCKLGHIKKVLISDRTPCLFVDVDCIFVKDFLEFLEAVRKLECDIIVCDTSCRKQPSSSRYIGSFYCFLNNKKDTIKFLKNWEDKINNDKTIKTNWRESPALTKTMREYGIKSKKTNPLSLTMIDLSKASKEKIKIAMLPESLFCRIIHSTELPDNKDPYIIHMKSDKSIGLSTINERINSAHAKKYVKEYLNV